MKIKQLLCLGALMTLPMSMSATDKSINAKKLMKHDNKPTTTCTYTYYIDNKGIQHYQGGLKFVNADLSNYYESFDTPDYVGPRVSVDIKPIRDVSTRENEQNNKNLYRLEIVKTIRTSGCQSSLADGEMIKLITETIHKTFDGGENYQKIDLKDFPYFTTETRFIPWGTANTNQSENSRAAATDTCKSSDKEKNQTAAIQECKRDKKRMQTTQYACSATFYITNEQLYKNSNLQGQDTKNLYDELSAVAEGDGFGKLTVTTTRPSAFHHVKNVVRTKFFATEAICEHLLNKRTLENAITRYRDFYKLDTLTDETIKNTPLLLKDKVTSTLP